MSPWPFRKSHSLGNDFVILDTRSGSLASVDPLISRHSDLWQAHVRAICQRHTGVGADGVLVVQSPQEEGPDLAVRVFNADGSEGATCLNGLAAVVQHEVLRQGKEVEVCIRMGDRLWYSKGQPGSGATCSVSTTLDLPLAEGSLALDVGGQTFRGERFSVGNPHYICEGPLDPGALEHFGPLLECHPAFPLRTNVEWVWPDPEDSPRVFRMVVWERGCGVTRACSSGAVCALFWLCRSGKVQEGEKATLRMPGGSLSGQCFADHMIIASTACAVFDGTWTPLSG